VGRTLKGRYIVLGAVLLLLLILVVLPLCSVFVRAVLVTEGQDSHFGLANFYTVVTRLPYWVSLGTTLVISIGATLLATVIGVALAWILVRTNTPAAAMLERLAVLPIFIPPFVGAFAWVLLAAPRIGLGNMAIRKIGLGEPLDVYSISGIAWVIGIYMAPYVLMIVAAALRSMDPAMEEVGQVSGLNRWRVAVMITLPVIAPAILSAAGLVFVIVIGLFGTPVLLGWPRQILTLTSRIWLEVQTVPPAYGVMAVLALYLVGLSTLAVWLQHRFLKGKNFVTVTGKGFQPRQIQLGGVRFALSGAIVLYIGLTVVVPVLVIAAASISTYAWSGRFTSENYVYLWESFDVRTTLSNSLTIAVIAATLAAALGLAISWLACRTAIGGRRLLEYIVLLPLSVPSMAFGIGVTSLWLRFPIDVSATIWVIVIGFIGRFSGYAVRTISGSLVQIHPELEESARICGYGPLRTVARITLPLVRPSIVSGWVLLYSIFMTELSMVLMLYNSNTRTFSVLTFELWYAGRFSRVSSLSLLQLFLGAVVMYIITKLASGRTPGTDAEQMQIST
jgi:iron(III) transport system permease protein